MDNQRHHSTRVTAISSAEQGADMHRSFTELLALMLREESLTPEKIRTFMELAFSTGRASAFIEMGLHLRDKQTTVPCASSAAAQSRPQ